MTHREALGAIPADALIALRAPSDRAGLLHLGGHAAVLMATGSAVLLAQSLWFLVPAMLVHGAVLVFLFAPAHECAHGTAFRTPWLNRLVGHVAGFLIILPPRAFFYFHMAHHRHTQDPDNDPELATPKPKTWGGYLWALTGWHYWRGQVGGVLRAALGAPLPDYIPAGGAANVRREARLFLVGYAGITALGVVLGLGWLITLWALPLLIGQPFLRAYLMAEHTGCPLVPDMLTNSRTTLTAAPVRFLAWNMPYHTAHHALPTVPFHRLGALTRRLRPHIRVVADGYGAVHREIQSGLSGSRPS